MFQLLLVSHGNLAKAMLESAEMIVGPQPDIRALGLKAEDSPEAFGEKIYEILEAWKNEDVMVLSDIRSGTPFNATSKLMQRFKFRHISGINLGMLIEALIDRDFMSAEEAGNTLIELAGQSILDVNALLED
ncbi:PTS sugar transporter subunit IIA [Chloroflexota bacterium]|nr:PTS sugar transporter subunit IIA [Chloroflexota bacterium]